MRQRERGDREGEERRKIEEKRKKMRGNEL